MSEAQYFQRLAEFFDRTVDLPEVERRRLLDPLREDDPRLLADVERLLLRDRRRVEAATAVETRGPGARVGPYRLVDRIGSGGMGEVYRAVRDDGNYSQTVAVKLVRAGFLTRALLDRFRSERQILARLEHPNIARLLDGAVGPDGLPYLTMEYVAGRPITEYCDDAQLSVERRLQLFQAVCRAVQFAHRNLIVHRDLKPSNILITVEGEVKLLDFGIAKLLGPSDEPDGPAAQTITLLTPEYASPEQVRGEAITTATDVYALGLLLHELLCGTRAQSPADGSLLAIERSVCEQRPPRPSETFASGEPHEVAARTAARGERRVEHLQRRLRGDLDNVVSMALRKDPARRYPSADELAADIERHLTGLPVVARPDTWRYRGGKFLRRHRLGLAAALAVVLAVVAGLGLALHGLVRAQRAERSALEDAAAAGQIADFLVGLFQVNDPGESQGNNVTARELLDRGASRIGEELGEQPAVQARLLRTMARAYESLGLYEPARRLVEQKLQLARSRHGEQSREAGRALVELAGVYGKQGDYERSLELAREGLAIAEAQNDPAGDDVAAALNGIGMAYGRLGDLEQAGRALGRALAIREAALGPDHRDLWSPLNNLAIVHWMRGDTPVARSLYERSLAIAEREFGSASPSVAHTLNNLALVHSQAGDHEAAVAAHERVLAIRERLLDANHPDIGESLNNLSSSLLQMGEFARAKEMSERALAIRLRSLGPEHDHVATTQCNLGFALSGLGRADAARPLFEHCLSVFESAFGPDHVMVAYPLLGLARIDHERGDDANAERRYRRVIEIRSRLGEQHPDLREVLEEFAEFERATVPGAGPSTP